MLSTLVKFSADDILKYFFLFSPENRLWHFMPIFSISDKLDEMSDPVFWENMKNYQFVICWISPERGKG